MNARQGWAVVAVLGLAWGAQGCTQCEENERNVDGQCVRLCNSNFDCAGGESCVEGACHPRPAGSSSSGGAVTSSSRAQQDSSASPGSSTAQGSSASMSPATSTAGSGSAPLSSSSMVVSGSSRPSSSAGATSGVALSSSRSSSSAGSAPSVGGSSSSVAGASSLMTASSQGAGSSSSQMGGCLAGGNTSPLTAARLDVGQALTVELCAPQPGPEYWWVMPDVSVLGARARLQVTFERGGQATDWDFHTGVLDEGVPRSLIVMGSCSRGAGRDEDCVVQLQQPGMLYIRAYSGTVGSTETVTMLLSLPPPADGGVDPCDTALGNTNLQSPWSITESAANTYTLCATYNLDQYFVGETHPQGTAMAVSARYPNGGGYALFDVVPGTVSTNGGFIAATITGGNCLHDGGDDQCTFTMPENGKAVLRVTTVSWAEPQLVEFLLATD